MDSGAINDALFARSQLLIVSHMLSQPLEEDANLKTSDEHERLKSEVMTRALEEEQKCGDSFAAYELQQERLRSLKDLVVKDIVDESKTLLEKKATLECHRESVLAALASNNISLEKYIDVLKSIIIRRQMNSSRRSFLEILQNRVRDLENEIENDVN